VVFHVAFGFGKELDATGLKEPFCQCFGDIASRGSAVSNCLIPLTKHSPPAASASRSKQAQVDCHIEFAKVVRFS
jgi:hypothetical protein